MPVPPLGEEQILEAVASGDQPAADIAHRAGMSILELAAHVCTPQNLEALARVKRLHAIQREMLLGKLKRDALVRLAELTDEVPAGSADEIRAFEVMRRACTDLIRYGGVNTEKRHSSPGGPGGSRGYPGGGYHPEPLTPAFEAEVLEALERLGEEKYDYEPRGSREPSGPTRRTSGSVELVPWSKAEPQATSGGDVVEEVEVTQEVQVGMAFGKTSDHGTGKTSDHGTSANLTRTGGTPMPPSEILTNHTCPPACPPGRGPVPLYVRSNQNRIMKSDRNMRFDDAHPP